MQGELVSGPYFDELAVGDTLPASPAVTLTEGLQAAHDAIVGNRVRLSRDHHLAQKVAGRTLVSPALAWDVSIGQSTTATHHVKANLFYRGLWFHRLPSIGDTLSTTTTVEALKQNSTKPGRPRTGLAVLHIRTADQHGRVLLDYRRCAMLPLAEGADDTAHSDDIGGAQHLPVDELTLPSADWDLTPFAVGTEGHLSDLTVGRVWQVDGADVVTSAPELARLTGNIAKVHHDRAAAGGERLVYGGHTIGIAMHHLTRALPHVVTVAGWHGCDHLGPLHEGDALRSMVEVEQVHRLADGGAALSLRIITHADVDDGSPRPVLDWRPVAVFAEADA